MSTLRWFIKAAPAGTCDAGLGGAHIASRSGAIIAGHFFLYDVFKGAFKVTAVDLTQFLDMLSAYGQRTAPPSSVPLRASCTAYNSHSIRPATCGAVGSLCGL